MTEDEFLSDVSEHVVEVLRDDGLYRHIRFRRPGTMCSHFDLLTWPGYLCYTGDMGTYVFCRIPDMFQFFRTDREYAERHGRRLAVNLSYWSEKLQAVDGARREASAIEFSPAKFRRVIEQIRRQWIRDARDTLSKKQRRSLWEAVGDEVLGQIEDGEHDAYAAARDFSWSLSGLGYRDGERKWQFDDLWDHSFTEYTHRFQWCCYALAWGIEQYELAKASTEAVA